MHIYRERGGDAGTESGYALKMRELIVDLGYTGRSKGCLLQGNGCVNSVVSGPTTWLPGVR